MKTIREVIDELNKIAQESEEGDQMEVVHVVYDMELLYETPEFKLEWNTEQKKLKVVIE